MRRFGFSAVILLLVFSIPVTAGCEKVYNEKEMGELATLTRTVMDIVSSEYIGISVPKTIAEPQIIEIVIRVNTDFAELRMLDKYDMVIVSDGVQIAAVVWDPENERKLIQDLRCTKSLDEPTWRNVSYGHEFTLNWSLCPQ